MEYELYQAKVVSISRKDNRVGVQVLPFMKNISAEDCPIWSWFFRDELHLCKEEDLVWVVCDSEFSNGYVLGLVNYTTYRDESFQEYSIPEALKDKASTALKKIKATSFDFTDLKVTFWNETSIHFVERSTGGSIIAYKSGTLYIMRPDEFLIKIGDSLLKLDSQGVNLSSLSVKIQGDVSLGNNPEGSVLVTAGSSSEGAIVSTSVRA